MKTTFRRASLALFLLASPIATAHATGFIGFNSTGASGSGMQGEMATNGAAIAAVGGAGKAFSGVQVTPYGLETASSSVGAFGAVSTQNAATLTEFQNFGENNFQTFGGFGF